jgi:putative SOS response-associated peptidase YedK
MGRNATKPCARHHRDDSQGADPARASGPLTATRPYEISAVLKVAGSATDIWRRLKPRRQETDYADPGASYCYNLGMCGRFYLTATAAELKKTFKVVDLPDLARRYNIAPTHTSPIVVAAGRAKQIHMGRWGLVPPWSRDLSLGGRMINAPAEAIEETPAFRASFQTQRCLVPANGYYEWQTKGTRKQPYRIALRNGALLAFAGLWNRWAPETGEPVDTFAIITTRANKLLNDVHERMPVVIAPADHQRWLTASDQTARRLLVPYTGGMTITPVSDRVNDVKQDDVGLIAPIEP